MWSRIVLCAAIIVSGCHAARSTSKSAESASPEVGDVVPKFEVTTLDGETVSTSEASGKVFLVNFFATWCGPCVEEMRLLEVVCWKKFREQGLMVVAIGSMHENQELIPFREALKVTYPIAGDPDGDISRRFGIDFFPQSYLVGKDGKILFKMVGYSRAHLKEMIERVQAALQD